MGVDLDDILGSEYLEEYHVEGRELEEFCEIAEQIFLEYNSNIKDALKSAAPETYIDVDVGFGPKLHFAQLAEKIGVQEEEIMPRHVFLVLSADFFMRHKRSAPDKCSTEGFDPSRYRLTWLKSSPQAVCRPDWGRKIYVDYLPKEFESILESELSKRESRSDAPKLIVDAVGRAMFNRRERAEDKLDKARYLATIAHEQTHIYLNEATDIGEKRRKWFANLSDLDVREKEENSESYSQIFDEGAAFFTGRALTGRADEIDESKLGERDGLPIGYKSEAENIYVARRLKEKWVQDSDRKAIDFVRDFMAEVFQEAFQQEVNVEKVFLKKILFDKDRKSLYALKSEKDRLSKVNRHLKEIEKFLEELDHDGEAGERLQSIEEVRERTVELEEDLLVNIYRKAVRNNMSLQEIHSLINKEEKEIVNLLLEESRLLGQEVQEYGSILEDKDYQEIKAEAEGLKQEAERLEEIVD